jgi:hypothetical protein
MKLIRSILIHVAGIIGALFFALLIWSRAGFGQGLPMPNPHAYTVLDSLEQDQLHRNAELSNEPFIPYGSLDTIRQLTKWWDAYKAECYADSTYTGEGSRWWTICIESGTTAIYKHEEPTLDGFMQFLKKKVGVK